MVRVILTAVGVWRVVCLCCGVSGSKDRRKRRIQPINYYDYSHHAKTPPDRLANSIEILKVHGKIVAGQSAVLSLSSEAIAMVRHIPQWGHRALKC